MVLPELLFIFEDHNLPFGDKTDSDRIFRKLPHLPSFPAKAYGSIFFNLFLVMDREHII